MSGLWQCPTCHAFVDYDDYKAAKSGARFICRKCGAALVIDRKADRPVLAKKPTK